MESRTFFLQLLLTSGLCLLGIVSLYQFPALAPGIPLAWISLAFFVLFSLLTYVVALRISKSSKKEHFINLILAFTLIKMLFSFLLIAAYAHLATQSSKLFALPFFGIYLLFTIFESAFMIRVGKRG